MTYEKVEIFFEFPFLKKNIRQMCWSGAAATARSSRHLPQFRAVALQ
jgi:hypothetical protein